MRHVICIVHTAVHGQTLDVQSTCSIKTAACSTTTSRCAPVLVESCFAKEEGARLADALGPTKKNMILQNHGLLTCGGTVSEAAAFFIALERACHCQLLTEAAIGGDVGKASGLEKRIVSKDEALYTKKGTGSAEVMYMQFEPEYRLILKETNGDFLL
jgi:ribulose-5-phosphate 4-epimerase/fuculose-1-phosphate aldolase